jgi:hypothetical protein
MRKFKQDIVKHECRGVQQYSGGAEIKNGIGIKEQAEHVWA